MTHDDRSPDPPLGGRPAEDLLDNIAVGYQASQILLAANRLGVFAALVQGPRSAAQLAADLDANPRGMRILCDALVDLGLLDPSEQGYRPGPEARRHLLPDSPEPRIDLLNHGAKLYERWAGLYDAVKTGAPIADGRLDARLLGSGRDFARAMADIGRRSAVATRELLDLKGVRHLLDLGGGPGVYAIEFARAWPELEVTVLDTSEALEEARRNLAMTDLEGRVHLRSGDAFSDSLGGPYSAIFISNLLHIYSAEDNRRLLRRCATSLEPNGQIILKDFFLDDDRRRPAGGAIFAVNMLVSTEAGDCYTVDQARAWLEEVGLEPRSVLDVASKSRLLLATRPA